MVIAVMLLMLLMSACGSDGGESNPSNEAGDANKTVQENQDMPTMKKMELSSMEEFYLNAFSGTANEPVLYEINNVGEYSQLDACLYQYSEGKWIKNANFTMQIKNPVSYMAVDYSDLSEIKVALKSGTAVSKSTNNNEERNSKYDNYSWDTCVADSVAISEEEKPVIAYRRYDANGQVKNAALRDFAEPQNIPEDDIEEYYILTVSFAK